MLNGSHFLDDEAKVYKLLQQPENYRKAITETSFTGTINLWSMCGTKHHHRS